MTFLLNVTSGYHRAWPQPIFDGRDRATYSYMLVAQQFHVHTRTHLFAYAIAVYNYSIKRHNNIFLKKFSTKYINRVRKLW